MKKLNAVRQKDLQDCGVCVMQWIIQYYDGYVSLERLRNDTYTDKFGTTAYHIVNAFLKWNFDALGIYIKDINDKNLKFPLIAHLKLDNGLLHFVVVRFIKGKYVYLMDPGVGYTKMNFKEFQRLFTGNVIVVRPRGKILKCEEGISIFELFGKILNEEKFLIIKIVITSLIWTILAIISSYYLKVASNILNYDIKLLRFVIFVFGIVILLKVFMLYIREYYENHLNNLVDTYLYPDFISHLFSLPLKTIKNRTTGEIISRVEELGSIKNLFSDIFVTCFLDSFMMLISIIILYMINGSLANILLLFIIIYSIFGYLFSKMMYKKVLENIDYNANFNSVLIENVKMFDSIKHLQVTDIILNKIEFALAKYLLSNFKFTSFYNIFNMIKDYIIEICFFLINSYGFFKVINGDINIVDLFTFNLLLSYSIEPVKNIINLLPKYNYIKASFMKIKEFLNIEEEKLIKNNNKLNGNISFVDVWYSYNDYDYALKNINLEIKENTHVLLNGTSGCGKSTICKLINKDSIPSKGSIYLDKVNILDIDLYTIKNNILYVSQNEELFYGTIKDNIILDRNISNSLFHQVCQICEIDSIVAKKSLRYDSLLDPDSTNISGGEKQRIILARGLLKDSKIIILDEALSEVDISLENKIIKNIRNFYKNNTLIYISHKNQIKNFENIINIGEDNGIL